jgi:hypothetical protein
MTNVIDFQEARNRRIYERELAECIDTHDAVLDISDVVLTADDLDYDVEITEDSIIIHTNEKNKEERDTEI